MMVGRRGDSHAPRPSVFFSESVGPRWRIAREMKGSSMGRSQTWNRALLKLAVIMPSMIAVTACGGGGAPQATPTATPGILLPPEWTPTAAVLASPAPDWVMITGSGIELWLPREFAGGDPLANADSLLAVARPLGADYRPVVETIENPPSGMVLLAFSVVEPGVIVGVTRRDVPSGESLDFHLDRLLDVLLVQAPGMTVLNRETAPIGPYQAGRVVFEFTSFGAESKQLSYVIVDQGASWRISYISPRDTFDRQVPIFEQSARSFRLFE